MHWLYWFKLVFFVLTNVFGLILTDRFLKIWIPLHHGWISLLHNDCFVLFLIWLVFKVFKRKCFYFYKDWGWLVLWMVILFTALMALFLSRKIVISTFSNSPNSCRLQQESHDAEEVDVGVINGELYKECPCGTCPAICSWTDTPWFCESRTRGCF